MICEYYNEQLVWPAEPKWYAIFILVKVNSIFQLSFESIFKRIHITSFLSLTYVPIHKLNDET